MQARGWEIFQEQDPDRIKGAIIQRGAGDYTLCERCNNNTGAWYRNAFVSWAYQAAQILALAQNRAPLNYRYQIYPLRVIKQVLCMFFSANGPTFQAKQRALVRFVLNREERYLDPTLRIYAHLNSSDRSRQTGIFGALNFESREMRVLSEITFPPMGFLMTLSGEPPDKRLVDISFFARYTYDDRKDISLNLPVLPVYSYLPADYRSREQLFADAAKNETWGLGR